MIRVNVARYPISARCRIPGVPRSAYYWMIGRPGTEHVDPIVGDVRAAWRDGRERYGARKIKAALERRGVTASGRRIGGIMREQGMRARHAQTIQTAWDAGRRGQAREPAGPAGPTATPRTRIRRATLPMSASAEAGRTCACRPVRRTGASPAIPPGGHGTRAWCISSN